MQNPGNIFPVLTYIPLKKILFMKKTIFLSLFTFFLTVSAVAQNFQEGLQKYEDGQYREAAEIFIALDGDQSILFAGKSYFDLQNYLKANEYLKQVIRDTDDISYRQEAQYTLALSHFGLKNYTQSLNLLHELITSEERGRAKVDAQRFYRQFLRYLTLEERFRIVRETEYLSVAKDVVSASQNYEYPSDYYALVSTFLERIHDEDAYRMAREELISSNRSVSGQPRYPEAPEGIVYNVGVILPAYDEQSADLLVPRNLYYGITLAAEEFNSQHSDKKISLVFENSHRNADSTAIAFHNAVWKGHSDALIGPLFSGTAERMARLSENHRIPMIAPLANSDDINLDYNYTFQMNPTFEVHGKMMARHAVQDLGIDTLAVFTQKNALGTASARSFRHEAERLGAFISYYIEEDFSSFGYDLSDFTKFFTTDSVEVDSLNYIPTQGIYAPFTGQAANTLINLLMTDLEVMNSDMVIMGSEEWENATLSNWQNRNFEIYYSKAFGRTADTSAVRYMEQDFQTRFGIEADQFAKIGFDVGTFLFSHIDRAGNPSYLGESIRNSSVHPGTVLQIDMNGSRINQHVFIRPLSSPAINKYGSR